MPQEISLEELQTMAPAQGPADQSSAAPLAPKGQELSLDDLNGMLKPKAPEPGFWSGVGKTIAGSYETAVKGLQIQSAESQPKEDELLSGYQKSLGDAQRAAAQELQTTGKAGPAAAQAKKLQNLVDDTKTQIALKNAQPEVQDKVKKLTGQINDIQAEVEGATPKDMGFWKKAAFNAAAGGGVIAPALVLAPLAGGETLPLAAIGLQTYASSYAGLRAKGTDPQEAGQLATVDGLAQSLAGIVPGSQLLKNSTVFKKMVMGILTGIPGVVGANYVTNATNAVAALGPKASDSDIQHALQESAKQSTKEAGSVAVSTVIGGAALAGAFGAAGKVMGGKGETTPEGKPIEDMPPPKAGGESKRGRPGKPPETPPPEAPPPGPVPGKPHFKSPAEAQAAQAAQAAKPEAAPSPPPDIPPEKVSEGSKPMNLSDVIPSDRPAARNTDMFDIPEGASSDQIRTIVDSISAETSRLNDEALKMTRHSPEFKANRQEAALWREQFWKANDRLLEANRKEVESQPPPKSFEELAGDLTRNVKEGLAGKPPENVVDFQVAKDKKAAEEEAPKPEPLTHEQSKAKMKSIDDAWVAGDISSEEHSKQMLEVRKQQNFEAPKRDPWSTLKETLGDWENDNPHAENTVQSRMEKLWEEQNKQGMVEPHKASYKDLLGWAAESKRNGSFYNENYGPAPEYPSGGITKENTQAHQKALRDWAVKGEFQTQKAMNERARAGQEPKGGPAPDNVVPLRPKDEPTPEAFHVRPANEAHTAWSIHDRNGDHVETFTTKETAETTAAHMNAERRAREITPTDRMGALNNRLGHEYRELFRSTKGTWDAMLKEAEKVAKANRKNDKTASVVVKANEVLQHLVDNAVGPYKDLLTKLQGFLSKDTTVHFQFVPEGENLMTPPMHEHGLPVNEGTAAGIYIARSDKTAGNSIYIKTTPKLTGNMGFVKTLVHEMWHAVTHDYIRQHWDSPEVKHIRELHNRVWEAMDIFQEELRKAGHSQEDIDKMLGGTYSRMKNSEGKTEFKGKNSLYGMTDVSELVAEAHSNPAFMQALAKISPRAKSAWATAKQMYDKIVGALAQAMGFNKFDATLLHEIFGASGVIAEKQKGMFPEEGKGSRPRAEEDTELERPPIYGKSGELKNKPAVDAAMKLLGKSKDKIPAVKAVVDKTGDWLRQVRGLIAPETLGPKAEHGAAILSKHLAIEAASDASFQNQSRDRRDFWEKNLPNAPAFIEAFERGWTPKDPAFKKIAEHYRDWSNRIHGQDQANGIHYDAIDNYLYHVFDNPEKLAQHLERKFGKKWGDPGFMKERAFDVYSEAIKAGFKLKYKNPEDIMLARQHASDIVKTRVDALKEMQDAGLAWDKKPKGFDTTAWRSPDGTYYYVHPDAAAILKNAWDTVSLWSRGDLVGDAFKGLMYLKNRLVPIKLGLSAFHALHVLTIHNATGMVRATKGLLLGNINPLKWMAQMGKASTYTDLLSAPKLGGRIRAIIRGDVPPSEVKPHEALAIQYMMEGGMMPEQSAEYKSNARVAFRNALLRLRNAPFASTARAAYEAPFAALDWMQHWMFEKWIPSLKTASYLNDVASALKADPTLLADQQRRQVAFHRLAKSVDNRYGEMVYKTMFWNKWVKDISVINLLSLGWQQGFVREYGGAVGDVASSPFKQGTFKQKLSAGQFDKPLFVAYYTAQSLMYGGLLTWGLTGQPPQKWKDYFFPLDGSTNPDGTPGRRTTMFYAKEFAAIIEHMEQEGVVSGLAKTVANKASGLIGMLKDAYTGLDEFGKEYRNPDGSPMEKFTQTMNHLLGNMTPISVEGIQEGRDEWEIPGVESHGVLEGSGVCNTRSGGVCDQACLEPLQHQNPNSLRPGDLLR